MVSATYSYQNAVHCEKNLFVLASRQKIPVLMTENNLPAAHRVFSNSPCQKSYGQKIPARNYR
jgi:hypothetical protein